MIRIVVVDDHPAMRTGLSAVLRAEPGMVVLATATSAEDLLPAMNRARPDVVVLDYHLPTQDGLVVCAKLKQMIPAPAVLLYSAYADAALAIPATLAGADGLLNKSVPANELYDAIRTLAKGERVLPSVPRELVEEARGRLNPDDVPLLGLALGGASQADMADALRMPVADVALRVDRMIERLRVEVPVQPA